MLKEINLNFAMVYKKNSYRYNEFVTFCCLAFISYFYFFL